MNQVERVGIKKAIVFDTHNVAVGGVGYAIVRSVDLDDSGAQALQLRYLALATMTARVDWYASGCGETDESFR